MCSDPDCICYDDHKECDESLRAQQEAITSLRNNNSDLESQLAQAREALEKLPGVGRKTANVMLNTAFGQPTIAVDTHIFRLGNRIRLAPGKTPLEVELKLLKRMLLNGDALKAATAKTPDPSPSHTP